jgi:hypothetical protein
VAARVVLAPRWTERVRFAIGAGVSSTILSGDYYDIEGPVHRSVTGPVLSASLGVSVTARLRLEFGTDYRVYSLEFDRWGTSSKILQHDLTLWSGFGVALMP